MKEKTYVFEKMSVPRAVATMAVPTIISMLVTMLYNMADTYFVGQTGSELMVSAVSLVTPIFSVLTAFGNLFGIGGSTAISRAMGTGSDDRVRQASSFCFYSSIAVGVLFAILVFLLQNPILSILGATEESLPFTRSYMLWIAAGSPFVILSSALGSIVRSEGAAKAAMAGNVIGTAVNIVLDPVMISGMGMGVTGAAIATVLGNAAAVACYLLYFKTPDTLLSILTRDFKAKSHVASEVLSIGIPTALNSMLTSASTIIMNRLIIGYGDSAVAGMGVAIKVNTMVIFILMGLSSGVQPILAYNYGSGNRKRLRSVFKFTAITSVIIGTALTLALLAFREPVVRFFIDNKEVVKLGSKMFGILQTSCPVIGLMFLGINTLQAFGKAMQSLILSVCRQGIVYIPLLLILSKAKGLYGAVCAQPISDMITVVAVMAICIHAMRGKE